MKKRFTKKNILGAVVIAVVLAVTGGSYVHGKQLQEEQYVSYTEFMKQLEDKQIQSVKYDPASAKVQYTLINGEKHNTDNPRSEDFKEMVLLAGVDEVSEKALNMENLYPYFMLGIMVCAMFFTYSSVNKGVDGKVNFKNGETGITFDDIAGMHEIKEDLEEFKDLYNKKNNGFNVRTPKGLLFMGPPGTGKTLLVKALASELGVKFFAVNSSQFGQVFAGLGAKQINKLFEDAKKEAPSVIFIDEIESIGKERGGKSSTENDDSKTLAALLTNMDGFEQDSKVIVIAATNRPEDIDPALLRPGRFDKKFVINPPDKNDRREVIEYHLKKKNIKISNKEIEWLVDETSGFTPAQIETMLNEAALIAIGKDSEIVTKEMFETAIMQMETNGKKKKNPVCNEKTRKITAIHEAGHAIVAACLCGEAVTKITIIPTTSGIGGYTKSRKEELELMSVGEMKHTIMKLYAGRCAEYIASGFVSDEITLGCFNDMQRASEILETYGAHIKSRGEEGILDNPQLCDKTKAARDAQEISSELMKETIEYLSERKELLFKLADELLEKESLYESEITEILGSREEA